MSDIHSSQLENANVIQLENETCEIMWDLLHACNFAFTRVPIADLSLGWGGTHYVVDVLQKILMKTSHYRSFMES